MYNIFGFGKRIAKYRKNAGLTQEELATRLNITAQAVSKWENEISIPEVTLIPQLAEALRTTIEKLFGNESSGLSQNGKPEFPKSNKDNLKLVYTVLDVACYSDKEVSDILRDKVTFKDGSSADLRDLTIVNKGKGDIKFEYMDSCYFESIHSGGSTEKNDTFNNVSSLDLSVNISEFVIKRSKDEKTYINAKGSPSFISKLKVDKKGNTLFIKVVRQLMHPLKMESLK